MGIPVPKICPHHEVTLISASTLKTGITKMEGSKKYYRTWVNPGADAPLPPENLDNPRVPVTSIWLEIPVYNSKFIPTTLSDLYIFCTEGDPKINGLLEVAT
jgi:hypothetical protein